MTGPAIAIRGVTKKYGSLSALRGIDLEIAGGEVFALLGPNGAGKTTLVEILEGYRRRSGGEVVVLGEDPEQAGAAWRSRIGLVLQGTAVFDVLTVDELVREFARFYPRPLDVGEVIRLVGLEDKRRSRCGRLSGGQRRRVDLALGIVGDPELIFLDEPTTGLDPQGRRQLWDVVREFSALGKTVVMTTHYLEEAEELADRVGIIIQGRLVATGSPREIAGRAGPAARVRFAWPGDGERPKIETGEIRFENGEAVVATDRPTEAVIELARWARARGVDELPGLRVTRPSLEDVYLQMVEAEGQEPGGSE